MEYMRKNGIKIETRRPFMLTGWNFVDLLVLISYIIDFIGIAVGSSLHYSWPFRPLRLLSLSSRIQIVVICLMDSLPALVNVILLGMCVFFVFAVMGLQIFMGTMFTCNDNNVYDRDQCVGSYIPTSTNFNANLFAPISVTGSLALGVPLPRVWSLLDSNFDHIGSSFLTLFKVGSLNDWVPIMYQGIDSQAPELQPVEGSTPAAALFFIIFIFVGGFHACVLSLCTPVCLLPCVYLYTSLITSHVCV